MFHLTDGNKIMTQQSTEIGFSFNSNFLLVLKKCFDGFCQDGAIHVDTIGTILTMMGLRVKPSALKEIIEDVDEDGSG